MCRKIMLKAKSLLAIRIQEEERVRRRREAHTAQGHMTEKRQ
jgi:hypothetical protein